MIKERLIGAGVVFLFLGLLFILGLELAFQLLGCVILTPIAVFAWRMKNDKKWQLFLIKLPLNLILNVLVSGALIPLIISWYTTKDTVQFLNKMSK